MRVKDFMATSWNIPLTENHYFVVISTYTAMFWKLSFPFLIWFKRTKFIIIIGGVLLHVGIWIFMRIDNFSWVMLSTYFVFITNNEYLHVFEVIKNQKLIIFLDGWCPMCQKFGKFVTKFDVFKLVTLENIRTTDVVSSMSKERGLKEMVTINKSGKIYYGFNSIFQISLRIPLFWIFVPFLFLLKMSFLGNYLYTELAIKRNIIPINCDSSCKV